MKQFRADLHIHSLLSPCGSLEMSPVNIINAALEAKLDIIAITDHNSTKQAPLIEKMAQKHGLTVFCGAEVNSFEEVHCVTLFETIDDLNKFQTFIDQHLMPIKNDPSIFGEQVVVDEQEMIVEEVPFLLINALNASLIDVEKEVHKLGGLIIPAHIDRPYNGLFSQLGFIPEKLKADAFELSKNARMSDWVKAGRLSKKLTVVRSSDAHFPDQIGQGYSIFEMEAPVFSELKMALKGQKGRQTIIND